MIFDLAYGQFYPNSDGLLRPRSLNAMSELPDRTDAEAWSSHSLPAAPFAELRGDDSPVHARRGI
eukprot:3959938-Heterocapsa_arctica.AAC.1